MHFLRSPPALSMRAGRAARRGRPRSHPVAAPRLRPANVLCVHLPVFGQAPSSRKTSSRNKLRGLRRFRTSDLRSGAPLRRTLGCAGGEENPLETIKFSSVLPIKSVEGVPGHRRKCNHCPGATKKYSPWRKEIGGTNVEMRSLLRRESPPRPLRGPSRALARKSAPGKGSCRARSPRTSISPSRKGCFPGIANHPRVIRGEWMNIKKVYGNRHFPVDTANVNF
jgi:hypothetical protein